MVSSTETLFFLCMAWSIVMISTWGQGVIFMALIMEEYNTIKINVVPSKN